jgi:Type III flagellar switch regulator (C-ring) FliN C-term
MSLVEGAIEGLTGLRAVNPVEVDLTNTVIATLHGQQLFPPAGPNAEQAFGADGEDRSALTLHVSALDSSAVLAGHWFSTSEGCAFQILVADGKAASLEPSRLEACVEALNAVDPLMDVIEDRVGLRLEPIALGPITTALPLIFSIEARDAGSVQSHILIAAREADFNPAHLQMGLASRAVDASSMPCPFQMSLRTTGLLVDEAAGIDRGDLLLLEKKPTAEICWPVDATAGIAVETRVGWLDMETGTFGCAIAGENSMIDATKFGGFSVPVTIALPARTTSLENLSALQPGASLPLGAITEGLVVVVSVGGRPIARGEIVQIGDRFAVHIEERIDMDDVMHGSTSVEAE